MEFMPRKVRKAWDRPGHAHFLTYSCHHRWPLLSRDRACTWVVEAMEKTRRELAVGIWAYVIMPEHVHIVLRPQDDTPRMRVVLASLKRPVSKAARSYLETTGNTAFRQRLMVRYPSREVFRFWQPGGGYDENIFREKTVREIIDYIHANPVRRSLVDHPTDWAWSSARWWAGESGVPIMMDTPDL